jgi:hypothetical protein
MSVWQISEIDQIDVMKLLASRYSHPTNVSINEEAVAEAE